jgi:hypothetical protein
VIPAVHKSHLTQNVAPADDADELPVFSPPDLNHIIRDKTVPAGDQFQRALALANAAMTDDDDS